MTAAVYNVNRRKGSRLLKADDFIPKRRTRQPQTAHQMMTILKAYTVAMGGTVIEQGAPRGT